MSDLTQQALHEVTEYAHGAFCWAEMLAADMEAARVFYAGLFGWSYAEVPVGGGMLYTVCELNGKPVAGIGGLSPAHLENGAFPSWGAHISVQGVDALTAQAVAAGATLLAGPMDSGDMGRWSCFMDPTGGVITLWEPHSTAGAAYADAVGAAYWHELYTHDVPGAMHFYTKLLGWTADATTFEGRTAYMCSNAGHPVAMILPITPEMGEMPTNWALYFRVADVPAACARIVELGGKIVVGPSVWSEIEYPFAVAEDTQGAIFYIVAPRS